MLRSAFFAFLLSFPVAYATAQQRIISNQQVFKVEDGLPQSLISSVVQDKDGFIWVSTLDGIARYDGRSFKIMWKNETGATGFRSQVVNSMVLNADNHITILYQGVGIDDFDPVTFEVTRIKSPVPQKQGIVPGKQANNLVNFAYKDGEGKGIHWADPVSGQPMYAGTSNGLLHNDTICGITQNAMGTLFVLTASGVEVSKDNGHHFSFIPLRIPYDSTSHYFKEMLVLRDGAFVIKYANKLAKIDLAKKAVSYIETPASALPVKATVHFLNIDHHGQIYYEQLGSIYRIDKKGNTELLWKNEIAPLLNVTACLIDNNDVLWVSVNAQGLTKVNLLANSFQSWQYRHGFFIDVFERAGIPPAALPASWFEDDRYYYFYSDYDQDSVLYLCYGQPGTSPVEPSVFYWQNKALHPLPFPPKQKTMIRGMTTSPKGEIWAADIKNDGLWYWENKTSEPQFFAFDSTDLYNSKRVLIGCLKWLDNQLWVSTHGKGLFLFENGELRRDFSKLYDAGKLPDNLTDICADPSKPNLLWIGTRGKGLILFDKQKGLQRLFTTENGLPNNTVYAIVPDANGLLWLSTNKGICRFDPVSFTAVSFIKTDGLAGNEFNRYHKFIFRDGRIAMGGLDGYTIFHPSDFTSSQQAIPVNLKITGIEINNMPQQFADPDGLITQPFTTLQKLELPYNKNYLAVTFAALQYNDPPKTRYRYMLKGADDTWRESGANNVANYTQLRPGHYTLLMNATALDGLWSSTVLKLEIVINAPFWATWWAFVIYALIGAVGIRYYFVSQQRRLKQQQQLAYEQKEAERLKELDEVKSRFFSNVTHEFRTPLTLILTPLEKLQQDNSLSPATARTVNTIHKNTRQLLRLINEFLDFSKLNDGQMKVNLRHGDLSLFVSDIVQQFEHMAAEKNIHLVYTANKVEGFYLFDKEKWEKILLNLLGNAIKFTPAGGDISVGLVARPDHQLQLTISDTGIGIRPDQLPHIFDRFYQADSSATRHYGGTGIGLSLVKELVELMQGTITAASAPDKGTAFTINLPIMRAQAAAGATNGHAVKRPTGSTAPTAEQPLILLAEDNPELRAFLAESLAGIWRISTAADGVQAWENILAEMPDLVISDVMMPERDGLELCRLCKEDARTSHIGFILLTSRTAQDVKMQGLETGADDYITKPFHLDELQLRVSNLLAFQQKQRAFLQAQALPERPDAILPKVEDAFLQQLYDLLDNNLDEPQLSVEYIAKSLAMSRSSLNRKLKSLLDITANDLIKRYRLQKAAALLAAGHDITSTTYKVGFNTPSYFTQCFKEQYGITPSEYIASMSQAS
jgi:signal transduction histidine kinase/DNA-binding response OmpR family regulator